LLDCFLTISTTSVLLNPVLSRMDAVDKINKFSPCIVAVRDGDALGSLMGGAQLRELLLQHLGSLPTFGMQRGTRDVPVCY